MASEGTRTRAAAGAVAGAAAAGALGVASAPGVVGVVGAEGPYRTQRSHIFRDVHAGGGAGEEWASTARTTFVPHPPVEAGALRKEAQRVTVSLQRTHLVLGEDGPQYERSSQTRLPASGVSAAAAGAASARQAPALADAHLRTSHVFMNDQVSSLAWQSTQRAAMRPFARNEDDVRLSKWTLDELQRSHLETRWDDGKSDGREHFRTTAGESYVAHTGAEKFRRHRAPVFETKQGIVGQIGPDATQMLTTSHSRESFRAFSSDETEGIRAQRAHAASRGGLHATSWKQEDAEASTDWTTVSANSLVDHGVVRPDPAQVDLRTSHLFRPEDRLTDERAWSTSAAPFAEAQARVKREGLPGHTVHHDAYRSNWRNTGDAPEPPAQSTSRMQQEEVVARARAAERSAGRAPTKEKGESLMKSSLCLGAEPPVFESTARHSFVHHALPPPAAGRVDLAKHHHSFAEECPGEKPPRMASSAKDDFVAHDLAPLLRERRMLGTSLAKQSSQNILGVPAQPEVVTSTFKSTFVPHPIEARARRTVDLRKTSINLAVEGFDP